MTATKPFDDDAEYGDEYEDDYEAEYIELGPLGDQIYDADENLMTVRSGLNDALLEVFPEGCAPSAAQTLTQVALTKIDASLDTLDTAITQVCEGFACLKQALLAGTEAGTLPEAKLSAALAANVGAYGNTLANLKRSFLASFEALEQVELDDPFVLTSLRQFSPELYDALIALGLVDADVLEEFDEANEDAADGSTALFATSVVPFPEPANETEQRALGFFKQALIAYNRKEFKRCWQMCSQSLLLAADFLPQADVYALQACCAYYLDRYTDAIACADEVCRRVPTGHYTGNALAIRGLARHSLWQEDRSNTALLEAGRADLAAALEHFERTGTLGDVTALRDLFSGLFPTEL